MGRSWKMLRGFRFSVDPLRALGNGADVFGFRDELVDDGA